jgi:hypothetical protein
MTHGQKSGIGELRGNSAETGGWERRGKLEKKSWDRKTMAGQPW